MRQSILHTTAIFTICRDAPILREPSRRARKSPPEDFVKRASFMIVKTIIVAACLASATAVAAPRTVAVAYFDNNTGKAEYEPLRKGLADMLITDLANLSSIQVVEREKLNQVLAELRLSRSKFIDPKTAQKLGKGLAAEFILTGHYMVSGKSMRIDARVVQVATGEVIAADTVEGGQDEFFSLEKNLVELLVRALNVKLGADEKRKLRNNPTQSFAAWSKYSAGLDAADRGNDATARALFAAALKLDPNYAAAKTRLERVKVGVVGVAECDEYIQKMTECSTKIAPEAAGAIRESMATMEKAWQDASKTPEGRAALASACKQALDVVRSAYQSLGCTF